MWFSSAAVLFIDVNTKGHHPLLAITILHCWKITFEYRYTFFPHNESLAESVLFFLSCCLTSHRLLPLLAKSRGFFFFSSGPLCGACLCCDILVLTKTLGEEKKNLRRKEKREREKDKNAARQLSRALTEPLFSTHCLRCVTMHTKYIDEWLK